MKKKLLFISVFVCSMATISYGQTQVTPKETTPVAVSSNPALSAHLAKIEAKQAEIKQSVTSSRAQVATLNDELIVLQSEYVKLLNTAVEKTSDEQHRMQLQEEIKRYSTVSNSQKR